MTPSSHHSTELDTRRAVKSSHRRGRLEDAIANPGAVNINVKGAYIVDEEPRSRSPIESADGVYYESQDIRLPHHTGVVSHIAADVSFSFSSAPVPRNDSYPRNRKKYPDSTAEQPA